MKNYFVIFINALIILFLISVSLDLLSAVSTIANILGLLLLFLGVPTIGYYLYKYLKNENNK